MALIRITFEFNQKDHKGQPVQLKAIVEKEISEESIESLDDCEQELLEICYAGMRGGMQKQMSYVSKKKALRYVQETKQKKN